MFPPPHPRLPPCEDFKLQGPGTAPPSWPHNPPRGGHHENLHGDTLPRRHSAHVIFFSFFLFLFHAFLPPYLPLHLPILSTRPPDRGYRFLSRKKKKTIPDNNNNNNKPSPRSAPRSFGSLSERNSFFCFFFFFFFASSFLLRFFFLKERNSGFFFATSFSTREKYVIKCLVSRSLGLPGGRCS